MKISVRRAIILAPVDQFCLRYMSKNCRDLTIPAFRQIQLRSSFYESPNDGPCAASPAFGDVVPEDARAHDGAGDCGRRDDGARGEGVVRDVDRDRDAA